MKDPARTKLLEMAKSHIRRRTDLAFDVASECGQMFGNVRHMRWFLMAVVHELEGKGD